MAMAGTEIERLIKQAFPDAQVIVVDLAGDGDHYGARVTSAAFVGKSRIQQHQMVYGRCRGRWAALCTRSRSKPPCRNDCRLLHPAARHYSTLRRTK